MISSSSSRLDDDASLIFSVESAAPHATTTGSEGEVGTVALVLGANSANPSEGGASRRLLVSLCDESLSSASSSIAGMDPLIEGNS